MKEEDKFITTVTKTVWWYCYIQKQRQRMSVWNYSNVTSSTNHSSNVSSILTHDKWTGSICLQLIPIIWMNKIWCKSGCAPNYLITTLHSIALHFTLSCCSGRNKLSRQGTAADWLINHFNPGRCRAEIGAV